MTVQEKYKSIIQTVKKFREFPEDNVDISNGKYLGLYHAQYIYIDDIRIRTSVGLRGYSYVMFVVKDNKVIEVVLLDETTKKFELEDVVDGLQSQILNKTNSDIVKRLISKLK